MLKLLKMESSIIFYGDMNFNQITTTVVVEIKKASLIVKLALKNLLNRTR